MRTEKQIKPVISMTEWTGMVKQHYSDDEQTKRIEETVRFIFLHCSEHFDQKQSVFSGVWGYLDVDDKKHLRKFKKRLRETLKTGFTNPRISYDVDNYDIIVRWE